MTTNNNTEQLKGLNEQIIKLSNNERTLQNVITKLHNEIFELKKPALIIQQEKEIDKKIIEILQEEHKNKINQLEEENKILLSKVGELDEINAGYRLEIYKIKTDYEELKKDFLLYEEIIMEGIKKNLDNNNGTTSGDQTRD